MKELKEFIERAKKKLTYNEWIYTDLFQAYIRKSFRLINDERRLMFDIATITVKEGYRRQGVFKNFLKEVKEINPWDGIYIECVMSDVLVKYFERTGWTRQGNDQPPSYYLMRVECEK